MRRIVFGDGAAAANAAVVHPTIAVVVDTVATNFLLGRRRAGTDPACEVVGLHTTPVRRSWTVSLR
jgi:hypothetical protein